MNYEKYIVLTVQWNCKINIWDIEEELQLIGLSQENKRSACFKCRLGVREEEPSVDDVSAYKECLQLSVMFEKWDK